MIHKAVLLNELVNTLDLNGSKVIADLTLGAAGHSNLILKNLNSGKLICFDLSFEAISNFNDELIKNGFVIKNDKDNIFVLKKKELEVILVHRNFTELKMVATALEINNLDGVIADLGWSSDELGNIEGLSYENVNDYLDMRFDKNLTVTAADLLNGLGRSELSKMFERYADVFGMANKNLVNEVITFRNKGMIQRVRDLKMIIDRTFKFNLSNRFQKNEIYKTYSRIFQSLRIAVNGELMNLEKVLNDSFDLLNKKGTMGIISFHSGEDKVIVPFLQSKGDKVNITSKQGEELFLKPSIEEVSKNNRARSAKLYSYIKL